MALALEQADLASAAGDVPVGCVVVDADGTELGRGYNRREQDDDPTAHAEVIALRLAAQKRGHWRLEGATLYVTLEPCPMCAGALVNARIGSVVYGAPDPKAGALHSLYALGADPRLNHRFESVAGVLVDQCVERLQTFFARLRAENRGKKHSGNHGGNPGGKHSGSGGS